MGKIMPHVHIPKPAPRAVASEPDSCPELSVVTRMLLQMMQVRSNLISAMWLWPQLSVWHFLTLSSFEVCNLALQGSVQLPPMDASVKQLQSCFSPAVHAADQFWTLQLERCVTMVCCQRACAIEICSAFVGQASTEQGQDQRRLKHDGRAESDTETRMWIERSVSGECMATLTCVSNEPP